MKTDEEKACHGLSPFELKDRLVALAAEHARRSTQAMLDAGRGNPNWVATTPREAFFLLGRFAVEESMRQSIRPAFGGPAEAPGIAQRLACFLGGQVETTGLRLLREGLAYAAEVLGCAADGFVFELVDGILGDHYPNPGRVLPLIEDVLHAYLVQELCAGCPPAGRYRLFAVEGATAGICYVFDSLVRNRLLHRGDTIALGVPTFTPYLEIPGLDHYQFKVVEVVADEGSGWQYPDGEIDKLADPAVKAFLLVNPGNPTSVAMRPRTLDRLAGLVREQRPELILVTDDVYATFVDGYRSLLAEVPRNTLGIYSFSKYFGCTGWRLGFIALHEDNALDDRLAQLPQSEQAMIDRRYGAISLAPRALPFIERMVADSRRVALHHTAGLATPQQIQMALLALSALTDKEGAYKQQARQIVRRRRAALCAGLGASASEDPLGTAYYETIDLERWLHEAFHDVEFVRYVKENFDPLDIVFSLAERYSTVLLPGGGFDAPAWSVRVSLANLPDESYERIGENLRAVVQGYHDVWQASRSR